MLKKLIFIFIIFCCVAPAHGLTLKVKRSGDAAPLEIPLHTTKQTEHALAVKTTDGTIYYADMEPVAQSFPGSMFARIDSQIYQIGPTSKFFVTTTPDTNSFSFSISAAGNFTVVWGDGAVQEIVRTDTTETLYSHTYATAGTYTIGIGGQATGYAVNVAAISFQENKNVGGIRGSLGAIFGTIGTGGVSNGLQPCFRTSFYKCTNLTGSIPKNLFVGLSGQPSNRMFDGAFYDCAFTGSIPENLFADLSGAPTFFIFHSVFQNNYHLTGSIPKNLFAGIKGKPALFMFMHSFVGCDKLSGPIPENLFGGIYGEPQNYMFAGTFSGCSRLTSIPANLFGNISGVAADNMFEGMFGNCSNLTGESAKINGKYLYEIWSDATAEQVGSCYRGATGLSDYSDIPAAWK